MVANEIEERYSRQILFSKIGDAGQKKIAEKHVLIIGAGALGTSSAELLTRAGIGKITIADRDYVEWSNLQRQCLYSEDDAKNRTPKAIAARTRLKKINSFVDIEAIVTDVGPIEMEELVKNTDLVIDATDNFDTRMIINDITQKYLIPWIYGACVGSYGLSYTILPGKTPCLHCLLESIPIGGQTCDTSGIIGTTVSMVTSHQVTEAIKILIGDHDSLRRKLISFDLWENRFSSIEVGNLKKKECPSCGNNPVHPFLKNENQMKAAVLCGRNTVQIRPPNKQSRDLSQLEKDLKPIVEKIKRNPYLISITAGDYRLVIFKDGRVLIHGTNDIKAAKSIYHRYLG